MLIGAEERSEWTRMSDSCGEVLDEEDEDEFEMFMVEVLPGGDGVKAEAGKKYF